MNRIKLFLIFILFNQIYYVHSPIPSWELSSQSIDLLSSKTKESILRYRNTYDEIN